jgi:hypothetical protein
VILNCCRYREPAVACQSYLVQVSSPSNQACTTCQNSERVTSMHSMSQLEPMTKAGGDMLDMNCCMYKLLASIYCGLRCWN